MQKVLETLASALYKRAMKMKYLPHVKSFSVGIIAASTLGLPSQALAQSALSRPVSTSVQFSGSCSGCDLSNRVMPRISMQESNFSGSDFSHSNLSGAKIFQSNFSNASFHKAYLMRIEGRKVNLSQSILRDSNLTEAELKNSDFSNVDLRGADMTRGVFDGSDFTNANLESVNAADSIFRNSDFSNTHLHHADFTRADLSGVNFTGSDLGDMILTDSQLAKAILTDTKMGNVVGLSADALRGACGNAGTILPANIEISTCVSAEQQSAASAVLDGAVLPRSTFADQVRNVARTQSRAFEIEQAISELDAAMRDLPIDSPTRARLVKSRDHLEKARAPQRR